MSTLYLITHAHTRQQRTVDAAEWVLSETGTQQALILAQQPFWNQVDRIVVSSEPKTSLTVEPVLHQRQLPLVVNALFDELQRTAEWIYDYGARVAEVFAHPHRSIGGWEPAANALSRVLTGIATLRTYSPHETIALVGHGLTLSLYRSHLLGQNQVNWEDWRRLSFAAVAIVDLDTGKLLEDFCAVAGESPRG
jgi:broad specificity phosphatase PhoE